MEPRIVDKEAFTVVGMIYFGENRNGEITQLWTEFNRRFDKVPHRLPEGAYGFCFMDKKTNPNFWYICATGTDDPRSELDIYVPIRRKS